ncbi:hypothetical protein PUMCH_004942 [Australozyma saopauloensis]|uniref:Uncharacterized protein n=1 Tax=Australozyma saopauloensis TaxID=291208 RepID=A0AAX4HGE3_9ASCO|nr:hypothetical protein PUMCH_004942 [[Candida] saopauloensis]
MLLEKLQAIQGSLFKESCSTFQLMIYAVTSIVVYVLYRHLKLAYLGRKLKAAPAPSLPSAGFFNSRPAITVLKYKREGRLLEFLWGLFYGDNENFSVRIGGKTLFATSDPENIKALLATQFNDFELGVRHSHFKPLLGDGIFTLDYDGWKHSRALLRPNFSREKIGHTKALESHVQALFYHVKATNGAPFDIQNLFFKITVDTATEFLFGHSAHSLRDGTLEQFEEQFEGERDFYRAFNCAQETLASRAWLQQWYWLICPRSFLDNCKVVHNFADFYVNKALSMSPEEVEKKSETSYTFLYELVKSTRNPRALRDQLLNIMIAGRDTTAGLMSFTMFELARNPDVWEKLKQEIHEHFGSGKEARTEDMTFETLKKCNYLKNVINEVLRLYPSVPVNYRFANKNTTLPRGGGKDGSKPVLIEKGECIGYLIVCTHRNEKYFGKDAHVFRPERWDDKSLKPGWAYLPFNGGPRICLGQQFAITEASYIISRIAQEFPNLRDCNVEPMKYPPRITSQLTSSVSAGCCVSLT